MLEKNPDLYYYDNPDALQQDILNHLSDITNGKISEINPNTTFGFLLDSFTTVGSFIVKGIEEKLNSIYPKRALSTEELYQHISDFDYISFQANPASYTIGIKIAKYIIHNTVIDLDDFYKAIIIPKDTVFKIGNLEFGIYHDIYIKVNKITKNILIDYDLTPNPLCPLKNYNIPYEEFRYEGVEYISFEIPIYQFSKTQIVEEIDQTVGFIKTYNLSDQFYAVRVYDIIKGYEFNYSMSDINYDPFKPTCIIKYLNDTNQLQLFIPQVYFTNDQVSSKLFIEIYTTKGKINLNIDTTNPDLIQCKFKNNTTLASSVNIQPYVDALKKISSFLMVPLNNKIIGGKNSDNFYTIRNNIIYNLFSNRVLISIEDIKNYFQSYGFKVINKIDNLTNRTYYALNHITDTNQDKVLLVNNRILLDLEKVKNNDYYMEGIINYNDIKFTLLPKLMYKYEDDRNLSIPLTKDEYNNFNIKSTSDKISYLNDNEIVFYPYHLVLDINSYYPKATSYDLISCKFTKFNFGNRHPYSEYQLYITDFTVEHLNNGCDGYKVIFGINKSDTLKDIPEEDIKLYIFIENKDKKITSIPVNYEYTTDDGLHIYSCVIKSDYYLEDNYIGLIDTNYLPGYSDHVLVPLSSKMYLVTYIKGSNLIGKPEYQEYNIFTNHPQRSNIEYNQSIFIDSDYIPIELFEFEMDFGYPLGDIIDNNITINYSPEEYVTYSVDIPLTYEHDIYEKDSNGKLVYTIENGEVVLNKLHNQGDIVYDSNGNIVYKHKTGEIKLDANGNPILAKPREIITNIDTFLISYKYRFSSDFNIKELLNTLYSYLENIRTYRMNLYGNTLCYFRPISTLGKGIFYTSDNQIMELNLNIKMGFKLYVSPELIHDDYLLNIIAENIHNLIKEKLGNDTISMYDIANDIKELFSEYIKAVDIKGINDDITLQTLIKTNDDQDLCINKKLVLSNDNQVQLVDDIDLEFLPV